MLKREGLLWADVAPLLETVDTVRRLESASKHPDSFLDTIATAGGAVAIKVAVVKLRPHMQPFLKAHGLSWAD
eukprot:388629-Prymnesium_polylepis.1